MAKSKAKAGKRSTASKKSAPKKALRAVAKKGASSKKSAAGKSALKKGAAKKTASKKMASKASVSKTSALKKSVASKGAAKKSGAAKSASAKSSASKSGKATVKATSERSATQTRFTPLDDRVLVEPSGLAERTAGGLYIPQSVQERPNQGRVIAVGKGARKKKGGLRPLDVRVGDQVLYGTHVGTSLELQGRDVILLREDEILGVLKA